MSDLDNTNTFGCPLTTVEARMRASEVFKKQGPVMYANNLIDQAAAYMGENKPNEARQTLNCAKWVLINFVMGDDD